ncbi:MAG: hypothetical protein JXA87_00110 [Thermoleophilia bacterium]|nr:hypothetical protein [Thermoleophilia bacterium]
MRDRPANDATKEVHLPLGYRMLGSVLAGEPLGVMTRLDVEIPGWRSAEPGQFALLQAEPSACFLARAISVADEAGERVSFLVAPVGEGTRELCALAEGDLVWVLGPLGRGFDVDALVDSPGRAVIVAGGVGVAPFPLLLARMAERYQALFPQPEGQEPGSMEALGPEVLVLLGFRDAVQAEASTPLREVAARMGEAGLRCRVEVATEDGSRGPAEKVTDLLGRHLRSGDRVAVCGPSAMAEAVWAICASVPDVETWFSLEASMACGVGSCHGCLITLADGSDARVCKDGPVFSGEAVFGG